MNGNRTAYLALLALSLAGAWGVSARDRVPVESGVPDMGPARSEDENVIATPTLEELEELFETEAPRSTAERKEWLIQKKLELARRAIDAAETAGTRELSPLDLEDNARGRSGSSMKKPQRLEEELPSRMWGRPGAPDAQAEPETEQRNGSLPARGAAATTSRSAGDGRALSEAFPTADQVAAALAAEDESFPHACTEQEPEKIQSFADSDYCQNGGFIDDDTCHYARGTTLILHVFVNHGALTWTGEERGQSIAKANQAKDWYRGQAPSNAYMLFDHEDTGGGYYITCNLPEELPDPGAHGWVDDACAALGFTDDDGDGFLSDELTVWYQDQFGGWDNVIAVFQPADVAFQATASMERGACKIPQAATWQTWSHEWGHCFGSNDEYGNCNGYGCGEVSGSCYLTDDVENGNCESDPCGASVSCMMKYNSSTVPPCSFTTRHWAWIDENGDGLLDTTLWNDAGTAQNLYELFHNGWFIHTNTDWGMVAKEHWTSWSVIGLRARGTAAYNLNVYGDNNYRYHQASSTGHSANYVNYVVGDFNRNNLGQDFIDVDKWSGSGQYVLTYESGTGMLFPDGVERSQTWADYNVVRAFDVPLFGGETITFDLDIATAGLDLGMALYKSNPGDGTAPYYAGRTNGLEQWEADDWPAGISESYTFMVPQDDVYGLIVWSNNELDGDWSIKIGTTPMTLTEEVPHTSFLDLRLYNYVPASGYWAVAAVRPEPTVNVGLSLFAESTYQTELASSAHYAGIEFIAADYNDGASADYLRVSRTAGVSSFTTEWEQGTEILNGFESGTWGSTHVCKVWDAYLVAGTTYFFRLYGIAPPYMDGEIFLMNSQNDSFLQRILRSAESTGHSGFEGEWFTYTPATTDWYGFVMVAADDAGGNDADYTIGMGPKVSLTENVPVTHPDEVVWADLASANQVWNVVGIRPENGATAQVGLWDCSNYATTCYVAADQEDGGVTFVAMDGRELGALDLYPRFDRATGSGDVTASFDIAETTLLWEGGGAVEAAMGTWVAGEVVQAVNVDVRVPADVLYFEVTPLVAGMDLGAFLLRNAGGDPVQASFEAIASSSAAGPGEREIFKVMAPPTGRYGVVVTNQNGVAGDYEIRVLDSDPTSDVADAGGSGLEFRMTSANPTPDGASFALSLPARDRVALSIFDVRGRRVRSLADGTMESGVHALSWDGKDGEGRGVAAGLYLARLETAEEERIVKLVRAE